MKLICCIVFAVCLALFPQNVSAQPEKEAGLWTTFTIEKELSDKISISLDEEFRLRENFTRLNLFYTNLGFAYKPVKWLKLGITYRLSEKWLYENQYFSFRHRLMFDLIAKQKFSNWKLSYRARVQTEVRDMFTSETGMIPEWYWRNKFDVKYTVGSYEPYIGTELRYQITDPRSPEYDQGWHRVRAYVGLDYELNKRNVIGAYYLIQREFYVNRPDYLYIIGLQYGILI